MSMQKIGLITLTALCAGLAQLGYANNDSDASKFINTLDIPETLSPGEHLPKIAPKKGSEVEFVGANYEQKIKSTEIVNSPLNDKPILLNYRMKSAEGDVVTSRDYKVTLKGTCHNQKEKPATIPEVQEWCGKEGTITLKTGLIISISDDNKEMLPSAQELQKDLKKIFDIQASIVTNAKTPTISFIKDDSLDSETYRLDAGNDRIDLYAGDNKGAYWSTRTLLQLMKLKYQFNKDLVLEQGVIVDYPLYKVRGFVIDVGRKPVSLKTLYSLARAMSWYKMNDLQVHLNDNYIWDPKAYIGFRLESSVKNLASKDLVYSKKEFRDFILYSKRIGVNIVPEFDTPGHAAAFVRANKTIARGDSSEYIDAKNPKGLAFVKRVISEYVDGKNPVFPKDTVLGIGTDEYKKGDKEAFRKYQDDLIKFVRDEKGRVPRVWGSQTENDGVTPITAQNVQMNLWYVGYANPYEMLKKGYDVINSNDDDLYIVPGAGYYQDTLNRETIGLHWQPNVIGEYVLPSGEPHLLGASYALWNDMVGPRDKGITESGIFYRFYQILPVFGSKVWGDVTEDSLKRLTLSDPKLLAPEYL